LHAKTAVSAVNGRPVRVPIQNWSEFTSLNADFWADSRMFFGMRHFLPLNFNTESFSSALVFVLDSELARA
jgi:hypothetical protein